MIGSDRFQHVPVDLHLAAGETEIDAFAFGSREVAHHLRQCLRERCEGQHDERLGLVEHLVDQWTERAQVPVAGGREARDALGEGADELVAPGHVLEQLLEPAAVAIAVRLADLGAEGLPLLAPRTELARQLVDRRPAVVQAQLDGHQLLSSQHELRQLGQRNADPLVPLGRHGRRRAGRHPGNAGRGRRRAGRRIACRRPGSR